MADDNRFENVVDEIISKLYEMNREYDVAIEQASKVWHEFVAEDLGMKEEGFAGEEDSKCLLSEFVDRSLCDVLVIKRKWEEKEMEIKVMDLMYQMKLCGKERDALIRNINTLERRLAFEEKKIYCLNEQISGISCDGNSTAEELLLVMEDLDAMNVNENIHPSYIIEMHKKLNYLQEKIQSSNEYLSKYLDFPPDLEEAKRKVDESSLEEVRLQMSLKNFLLNYKK